MAGSDKRDKALDVKEELLKEALDACMEEQLSFIPPECEIARMHTFSQEFREYMERLLKTKDGRSAGPYRERSLFTALIRWQPASWCFW